ncbi:hypothetical protein P152DRAFT_285412 [Eremomyces bilateralis CBS 781.70]|uniref:Cupin type-2 domain-containing protein n=1 Tax=Eremomyces bilateralis CBS 781.70 TaxID=1392243 RepID=A0A6G1G6C7_9PEZI|nr:uncharacterized protein P152DRAFT_285412 [Eremomyces bilateralis CBS 781.70]KAF1813572.1 hypothetical protein P152DRAFT_285412 [Eremomyces bilateralis CBS 781.70]
MAHVGDLPPVQRHITTHRSDGKAVFDTSIPTESKTAALPDNMGFALSYATSGFPISLSSSNDIATYYDYLSSPPGLSISNGSVLRHVDFAPGMTSAMHRTVSLDYGIVLEGEMDLVLDSGEERRMRRGDCAVQRGTMHSWRNASKTDWARMVFVLLPCEPILGDDGKPLGEELDTFEGVRASS